MNGIELKEVLKTVKQLKEEEQLQLIAELVQSLRLTFQKSRKHKLMDLAGVGADLWREIDVDEYLNQERASWD